MSRIATRFPDGLAVRIATALLRTVSGSEVMRASCPHHADYASARQSKASGAAPAEGLLNAHYLSR